MSQFTIGQTVKVIKGEGDFEKYIGREFKITNVNESSVRLDTRVDGETLFWNSEVESVDEEGFNTKFSGIKDQFESGVTRDSNDGKPRYDLVYTPMLKRWAELMGRGAKNHGDRNWEKASTNEDLGRFKESAFRHFMAWFEDQNDEDHAAAVFFNVCGVELVKSKNG